jgi:hypothetical protein
VPYPELGEGTVAGKNGVLDIALVIGAPLTLILSPRFAGGEERREAIVRRPVAQHGEVLSSWQVVGTHRWVRILTPQTATRARLGCMSGVR